MYTEADRHLDDANEYINKAIQSLSEILINGCEGYNEYNPEYDEKLEKVFKKLRSAKKYLNR